MNFHVLLTVSMRLLLPVLIVLMTLHGCSGGGGSSGGDVMDDPASPPGSGTPEPDPITLTLIDSIPEPDSTTVPADLPGLSLAHATQSDATFQISLDCVGLVTTSIRRSITDLSDTTVDQLVDHRLGCPEGMSDGSIRIDATRDDGSEYEADVTFFTTTDLPSLAVEVEQINQRESVEDLFEDYVTGALVGQLDLPGLVEAALLAVILDLASAEWDHLSDPDVLYNVHVQRVLYPSFAPDGASAALSGLVAFPDIPEVSDFQPRDQVLLLTHATGSTPSDLNEADAWYILANLLAGHGYLVIAPDNYGRGHTHELPETYLMGNRTGANAIAMVRAVTGSENYENVLPTSDPVDTSIIGYSQGGHSAIASWIEATLFHSDQLTINSVYAGGAPLHLYRTFRGVLQEVAGQCSGDGYCALVDPDTQVPFATDRILPGMLDYVLKNLDAQNLITAGQLNEDFVNGFLNGDSQWDELKYVLQLNSYPNIVDPAEVISSSATLHLYHSDYDRLVPVNNSRDFRDAFQDAIDLVLHENQCNSDGFEVIFDTTDSIGPVHTLCGLDVLDDVFDQLR